MRFIKSTNVLALVAAVVLATSACLALSIESSGPVKVTHRNSGPRYDIDEDFDRAKLTPVSEQSQQPPVSEQPQPQQPPKASNDKPQEEDGAASSSDQDSMMPVGHISIRRIFLLPMMQPPKRYWQENEAESSEQPAISGPRPSPDSDVIGQPGMFAKPFWPFLTPARPAHPHHLFGADEASRSPSAVSRPGDDQDKAASGAEREEDQAPMRPPMFDPIQMMVDMMHQAINSQLMPPTPNLTDLNKEASSPKSGNESSDKPSEERPQMPGDLQLTVNSKPIKPTSQNETHEDIIEIDGKKYLRKTVVNRHVGENIIFMTKRLIFVPLNETESTDVSNEKPAISTTSTVSSLSGDKNDAPTSTATPVSSDETTTVKVVETTPTTSEATVDNKRSTENKPNEESSSTTTVVSKEPTTPTSSTEPSATSAAESVETTTKAKSSWADRVTDVVDKAAERLVENFRSEPATGTSTEKPAGSN